MNDRREDRRAAQAVETVLALVVGVVEFLAVLIGSAVLARAVGAEPSAWIGPARIIGGFAGVGTAGWWLIRARRLGL